MTRSTTTTAPPVYEVCATPVRSSPRRDRSPRRCSSRGPALKSEYAPDRDHGGRRTRLPRLQHGVPRGRLGAGRGLHRGADPRDRGEDVPGVARRTVLPGRHPDPPGGGARGDRSGGERRHGRPVLFGSEPRGRHAQGLAGARRRCGLHAPRPARDDARGLEARRRGHGRANRVREEPDEPSHRLPPRRRRPSRRARAPSDAVRRPRGDARAALRQSRGHRPRATHRRGAGGVRGASRPRHDGLRGGRLRGGARAGAARVRRARLGRREQRPAVLPTRSARGRHRPAPRGRRAHVPPG